MLRRISILTAASAMLALSAWPASATALHPKIHSFSIPGLPGVSAWGSYHKTGSSVSVTVCVKDTSKNIDLATAIAIASDKSYRHYKGDIAIAFPMASTLVRRSPRIYCSPFGELGIGQQQGQGQAEQDQVHLLILDALRRYAVAHQPGYHLVRHPGSGNDRRAAQRQGGGRRDRRAGALQDPGGDQQS